MVDSKMMQPLWGTVQNFPKKLKKKRIATSSMFEYVSKIIIDCSLRDICKPKYTAALFVVAKR